jgi:predicted nucleic-acid-binding protein
VIGLDTNVLARYLVRDDAAQAARADREIEGGERLLFDGIVLCELVWVLEAGYGFSRTDITAVLERILATAQLVIDDKDLAVAALRHLVPGCSLYERAPPQTQPGSSK